MVLGGKMLVRAAGLGHYQKRYEAERERERERYRAHPRRCPYDPKMAFQKARYNVYRGAFPREVFREVYPHRWVWITIDCPDGLPAIPRGAPFVESEAPEFASNHHRSRHRRRHDSFSPSPRRHHSLDHQRGSDFWEEAAFALPEDVARFAQQHRRPSYERRPSLSRRRLIHDGPHPDHRIAIRDHRHGGFNDFNRADHLARLDRMRWEEEMRERNAAQRLAIDRVRGRRDDGFDNDRHSVSYGGTLSAGPMDDDDYWYSSDDGSFSSDDDDWKTLGTESSW